MTLYQNLKINHSLIQIVRKRFTDHFIVTLTGVSPGVFDPLPTKHTEDFHRRKEWRFKLCQEIK